MAEKDGMRTPLIGLPAQMNPDAGRLFLSSHYTNAIVESGGAPAIVPLVEPPEALGALMNCLDGILLTGSGSDVDPARYAAQRLEVCGPVQPVRDRTDFMLLKVARERNIPVLAICFGLQSLNVSMGGSLIQDISNHIETSIVHNNPETKGRPCHTIEIEPGSLLEKLAGGTAARVNSTHHQAVEQVGRDLEVIARAPDGVIEALSGADPEHWILGVQWHPEKSFAFDELSRRIFREFVAACRK